jgi:hypothetical protein
VPTLSTPLPKIESVYAEATNHRRRAINDCWQARTMKVTATPEFANSISCIRDFGLIFGFVSDSKGRKDLRKRTGSLRIEHCL